MDFKNLLGTIALFVFITVFAVSCASDSKSTTNENVSNTNTQTQHTDNDDDDDDDLPDEEVFSKAYVTLWSGGVDVISLESMARCESAGVPDNGCVADSYPIDLGGDGGYGLTISKDQSIVVATNFINGTIHIINTATDQAQTIDGFNQPIAVAIAPDNSALYVGNFGSSSVDKIDLATMEVCAGLGDPSPVCVASSYPIPVDGKPVDQAAMAADGSYLLVPLHDTKKVARISTIADTVLEIDLSQSKPSSVAIAPDGSKAYVTHEGNNGIRNQLVVLDLASGEEVDRIQLGERSRGVAFSPDGNKAYVADGSQDSTDVYIVDSANDAAESQTITVGSVPVGVAFNGEGDLAFVTNAGETTMSVIDVANDAQSQLIELSSDPIYVVIQD